MAELMIWLTHGDSRNRDFSRACSYCHVLAMAGLAIAAISSTARGRNFEMRWGGWRGRSGRPAPPCHPQRHPSWSGCPSATAGGAGRPGCPQPATDVPSVPQPAASPTRRRMERTCEGNPWAASISRNRVVGLTRATIPLTAGTGKDLAEDQFEDSRSSRWNGSPSQPAGVFPAVGCAPGVRRGSP